MTIEPSQDPAAESAPVDSPDNHVNNPLAAELAAINIELAQLREEMLRERADLDNQRKRLTREGVELTLKQLLKVTGDNGLVEVNPAGQPFNPEHHQAMSTVPSTEHPPGHVVQVYQKGWLLNERLLRPALVLVSGDA